MTQHIVEAAKEFVISRNEDHPILELDDDGEPLTESYHLADCEWNLLEDFEFLSVSVIRYCTEDDEYMVKVQIRCCWSLEEGRYTDATYEVYVPADIEPGKSYHFE